MSSSGDGGVFERFLNTTGDSGAGFKLVDVANPLQWTRFAQTVFASLLGGIVIGAQSTVDAFLELPAALLSGFADWIGRDGSYFRIPGRRIELEAPGLIETVENGLLGLIQSAWSPLEGLGWLAYPVAVAEVLAALYIVVLAVSYVREEVL